MYLINTKPVNKPPINCPKLNNNDKYPSYGPEVLFDNFWICKTAKELLLANLIKAIKKPKMTSKTYVEISLLVFICSFLSSYKLTKFLSSLTKDAITQLINTKANPINHKYFKMFGSVVPLLLNIEVIGEEIKSANNGGIDKTEIVKNVFDFEYCSSNNN